MLCQWVASVVAAVVISPRAWAGTSSHIHIHVWTAILLGGAITLFPVSLAFFRPGKASTRFVIAGSQMLMSGLLIHLSGGRIETHTLCVRFTRILAFYRDWRVFIPTWLAVAADHFLRGVYWPQSALAYLRRARRWVEHAAWVISKISSDPILQGAARCGTAAETGGIEATTEAATAASRAKANSGQHEPRNRTPMNGIMGMTKFNGHGVEPRQANT
jgi:hypothetical protein